MLQSPEPDRRHIQESLRTLDKYNGPIDGNLQSAAEQFSYAVRLSPNYPLGHLNLGIALAKLNRPTEAMTQFEETLRLDPNNQKATDYLRALTNPRSGVSAERRIPPSK